VPMPPPALGSPPPSLDDNSRAGQKRPADDTAPHTPTGWPTKVANQRGISSGHQRPAQDTTTIIDDRRQQYTGPTYDMGPRPEQQGPTPQASPQSTAILDSMDDLQEATTPDNTRRTDVAITAPRPLQPTTAAALGPPDRAEDFMTTPEPSTAPPRPRGKKSKRVPITRSTGHSRHAARSRL